MLHMSDLIQDVRLNLGKRLRKLNTYIINNKRIFAAKSKLLKYIRMKNKLTYVLRSEHF